MQSDTFGASYFKCLQIASFAGILVGGWVADRWSRTSVKGRVLIQLLGIGVARPFFIVGIAGSTAMLILALLVFGVGKGFTMPTRCQRSLK